MISSPHSFFLGHKNYLNKLYTWQRTGTTSDVTLFPSADFYYLSIEFDRKTTKQYRKKKVIVDDSIDNCQMGLLGAIKKPEFVCDYAEKRAVET